MIRGAGLVLVAALAGCEAPIAFTDAEIEALSRLGPLGDPPVDPTNAVADDPDAARLGQWLFYDAGLSDGGEVSCATCHAPALGWGDGLPVSQGLGVTTRHAPTLWNNAWSRWFFWDGRCDTAWCQALHPLEHPDEMGTTRLGVARYLSDDPALAQAWEAVFGPLPDLDGLPEHARPVPDDPEHPHAQAWASMSEDDRAAIDGVFADVGKAIAAYERLLVSRDAPFDAFRDALVAGEESDALSDAALRGARLFVGDGQCQLCHAGPNLSNGEFSNLGLAPRDWLDPDDAGRHEGIARLRADPFNGAGPHSDDPEAGRVKIAHVVVTDEQLGQFKVPTLRDVASHPPYMHGGHLDTLEDAVRHYAELSERPVVGHRDELLFPFDLTDEDVADLVAFLESLSGEPLDPSLLGPPATP